MKEKLFCLIVFLIALLSKVSTALPPSVTFKWGTAQGAIVGPKSDVASFFEIPFALPPVGNLRFRPPLPWNHSIGTLDASFNHRRSCYQYSHSLNVSEDCLFLNIWVPLSSLGATGSNRLPVFFWLHGGSFEVGSGSMQLYDGTNIASNENVIVVTSNYRMNAFGFLALNELLKESNTTGNYGIQDQQCSLKWVHDNIESFGGDPSKITLVGHSAGAGSTLVHMTLAGSEEYFSKVISQSAPILIHTLSEAVSLGNQWINKVGCSEKAGSVLLDCLRSLTPEKIIEFYPSDNAILPWRPVIDGKVIKENPEISFMDLNFSQVPLIIGTVNDEMSTLLQLPAPYDTMALPASLYSVILSLVLPYANINTNLIPQIMNTYPPLNQNDLHSTLELILSDYIFFCPARRIARSSSLVTPNSYFYRFYVVPNCSKYAGKGAFHGADVGYLFSNKPDDMDCIWNASISNWMQGYWGNFIKTSSPGNIPINWPQYSEQNPQSISINNQISLDMDLNSVRCNFWDSVLFPESESSASSSDGKTINPKQESSKQDDSFDFASHSMNSNFILLFIAIVTPLISFF